MPEHFYSHDSFLILGERTAEQQASDTLKVTEK